MDFEQIEKTFNNYVTGFDWSNDDIRLKYFHTLQVANISYEVARRLNLSNEERDLAKLIGYLHDIGRFIQVTTTNTFKDKMVKAIVEKRQDKLVRCVTENFLHGELILPQNIDSKSLGGKEICVTIKGASKVPECECICVYNS